ncbi:MAG: molybdopterin-dependent oxidoreductase [Chromatiales bacterium]|nr:MAG: molybdopterin-dependent oxidoreductase [Chromatiales bacterium]
MNWAVASRNGDSWHSTACILCSINCGLKVQTDGERHITKVIGDKQHPVSQGYVCEKAQRLDYYQNGADRLTSPMRRKADGTYEPVDWDTAIREISARMTAVRDHYGGDKILFYGGGGQGNHLGGAYMDAWLKALGVKYRSNALAQEKTGEFWVAGKMFGVGTHGDFEHCEVGVFLGKNPWQSHGFARARSVIQQIAKDPNRCLVVIDPRRSETAQKADYHLAVKPGTDAWLVAAMAALIVQKGWVDQEWVKYHTTGFEDIVPALMWVQVSDCAAICGVDEKLIREVTQRIAEADSVSFFEDLGVQMSVHSTLVSYLQRLIWLTTGHYGREGTANAFVPFLSLGKASKGEVGGSEGRVARVSPVAGAKIIIGLIPCNVIPEEILTDHPDRYRAMIIQSGNPVHSLADSQRMREALRALEFSVAIDVAMTETAREVDYVLPTPSQFEKAEATFFNLEFPDNAFHLRQPLFPPLAGTLDEGEITARLLEEMGELGDEDYEALQVAAKAGRTAFTLTFLAQMAMKPKLMKYVTSILYRTLGSTLPPGMAMAAVVWGLCPLFVQKFPHAAKRAGFGGPAPIAANRLFKAILNSPSGVVFARSDFDDSWRAIRRPDNRINLAIPELLAELKRMLREPPRADTDYPFILSAGERRSDTANTVVRDTAWHKKDLYASLRISPQDAAALGCETGDTLRLATRRASAAVTVEVSDMMAPGHISLPNGTGIRYTDASGTTRQRGVAPNEFTDAASRDFLAGTPWHKHVPARLEKPA